MQEQRFIDEAWKSVVQGSGRAPAPDVSVSGRAGLPSRLPVDAVATACVAAALSAAASLAAWRNNASDPLSVSIDRQHLAAAFTSERHFRRGNEAAPAGFAPLSRFWEAADGWVRTHANYPWHRAALLRCLGVDREDDVEAVATAIARREATDVEAAAFDAGGIAAAVRSRADWLAHPQGRAVSAEPLVSCEHISDGAARERAANARPAGGIHVLDLTRVIAGPVCTRFLGALGADVLRLDPPSRPDVGRPGTAADTLLAKRSALVDASSTAGLAQLHGLLDAADVVVCGYRPGALDRFDLSPQTLAARHPGLVVVVLDAWGHSGPWANRRGFDSVVQAPTGIAHAESLDGGATPGALPCQLLDHGTGYLAAAAALDGLRRQGEIGGTVVRRLALARTAAWLLESGLEPEAADTESTTDVDPWRLAVETPAGTVSAIAPPGRIGDIPLTWPSATAYGADEPRWRT